MLQSNPVRRTRIGWAGFYHEQDDDDDDCDHHHHHYWLWLLMKTINTTESGFWLEGFLSLWKVTCWMFNTFWEYYLRVLVLSKDKANRSPWLPNLVFKNWSIVIKNTHAVVDCRFWSKLFCWRDFSLETSLSSYQTETFWKLLTWQRNILQKCENALKKTLLNSWCVDTLVKLFGLKVSGIGLCLHHVPRVVT